MVIDWPLGFGHWSFRQAELSTIASNLRTSSPNSHLTPYLRATCHTPPLPTENLRTCHLSTGAIGHWRLVIHWTLGAVIGHSRAAGTSLHPTAPHARLPFMQPRDYVLSQIHHQDTPRVPYSLSFEGVVSDRLDAHYRGPAWRSRLFPYMANVAAVDTDMSTPISTTHRRDGYGGIWRIDQRPWHLETPPLSGPSFDGYTFPTPDQFFRPQWKAAAIKTCQENKDRFLIAGLGWGLFERTWNLRGFENALMDAISEPDFFAESIRRLADLYLAFVQYTADLPVDAICFGDDWGDQRGVIIGADRWRKFLKPQWARIYAATHAAGKLVMHHSCGSVAQIMPDLIEIGIDVLESCQPEAADMNPYDLKRRWGDKITFWGCLGSQSTIPFGTPDQIRDEVRKLCREMGKGGGYVLAPAKTLQPETPTANAVAIVEAFAEQNP